MVILTNIILLSMCTIFILSGLSKTDLKKIELKTVREVFRNVILFSVDANEIPIPYI